MKDSNGRRFKFHSRCSVFNKDDDESFKGAEIHAHCGLVRWKRVSQIILVTPFNTAFVVPEELWQEDETFTHIFGVNHWTELLAKIREVPKP